MGMTRDTWGYFIGMLVSTLCGVALYAFHTYHDKEHTRHNYGTRGNVVMNNFSMD